MASEQIRLSYKASLSCCKRGHDSHGVSALLPAPRPAQRQCRRVFLKFRAENTALLATGYGAQLLWPSSGSRLSLPAQKHETQATHFAYGDTTRRSKPQDCAKTVEALSLFSGFLPAPGIRLSVGCHWGGARGKDTKQCRVQDNQACVCNRDHSRIGLLVLLNGEGHLPPVGSWTDGEDSCPGPAPLPLRRI